MMFVYYGDAPRDPRHEAFPDVATMLDDIEREERRLQGGVLIFTDAPVFFPRRHYAQACSRRSE